MSKKFNIILGGIIVAENVLTEATTWGEFKSELSRLNLPNPHNALLAETKMALIDESILPETRVDGEGIEKPAHIFITPIKSKSGVEITAEWVEECSYNELKSYIKDIRTTDEEAKDFFGDYTHAKASELRATTLNWLKVLEERRIKAEKEAKKAETKVKESSVAVVDDPIKAIDSFIAILTKARAMMNPSTGNKLVFTVKEVTPEEFKKLEKLLK